MEEYKDDMPQRKEVEYNCMCDCLPCKIDGDCSRCNLGEIQQHFKNGDLCKEGDNSEYVNAWNECHDAWLDYHSKSLNQRCGDGICYYCKKPTNNLAANPSEWCIGLCHPDQPGKVKPHHIGCVSLRLHA